MTERWLPVVGHETRYHVSDMGRIYSIRTGRILKPRVCNSTGHLRIDLWANNRRTVCKVHHLVLKTFKGPRPFGLKALHVNDIASDNRVVNLYWGTRSQNEFDKVRNGRHHQARKTKCPSGHDYTQENTIVRKYGKWTYRYCKQCQAKSRKAS